MHLRLRFAPLMLLSVFASMGAQFRTANFVITTNTNSADVAQKVGQWAEHYRREKAQQWLGYDMPTWPQPCPLRVTVSMEPPQGKTSFNYLNDQVVGMDMEIQGPLDRLVYSVLPHEITHTVFAHYFRCAVPRWADEGGSVLSEDVAERQRHDQMTRGALNSSRAFRMRTLMSLTEYPNDANGVMCLYAQGFSLVDYLVKQSDHRTFLKFVAHAMRSRSWDRAVHDFYGLRTVEELEEAWLKHLRDTRKGQSDQFAQNTRPVADSGRPKTFVRTTLPPAQPLEPQPLYRGAAPDQTDRRFGDSQATTTTPPIYVPTPGKAAWQPPTAPGPVYQPAAVQLGQPQYPQYLQTQHAPPQYVQTPYGQPQCNGPQCQQQPYYQPQYGSTPAAPFGFPR